MNDADPRHGGYGHVCHEGCEVWKRAEPSQEAVEHDPRDWKYVKESVDVAADVANALAGRFIDDCRVELGDVVRAIAPVLVTALRAVEQRTRLETLERGAKLICVRWCGEGLKPRKSKHPDGSWEHPGEGAYGFPGYCAATPFWSEIASLQPREAPKAEEPKPHPMTLVDTCYGMTGGDLYVCQRSGNRTVTQRGAPIPACKCAAPQPGPEEGR